MARLEPEYVVLKEETNDIIKGLCDKYPDDFAHIDPEVIACAQIINKDRPPTCDWHYKIMGVKKPASLFSQKVYTIYWYKNWWEGLDKAHKEMFVAEALLLLPAEMDGSVLPANLKGVKCLCKAFGLDWKEKDDLPSLLEAKQAF